MRLTKLAQIYGELIYHEENKEREILFLCSDSRLSKDGCLFFCLTGNDYDGHDYAYDAVRKGALAIVTEKRLPLAVPQILVEDCRKALALYAAVFYGCPAENMQIIGVTGTNGKTSVTYMLRSILEQAGKKVGVIGTLGIEYGLTKMQSSLTTPDPVELHEILARMYASGVEYVLMEVSAHAIHYNKIYGIPFAAGVFTNCTQDHLDFFKTMERYAAVKSEWLIDLSAPVVILNGDDETGRQIGKRRLAKGGGVTYYGLTSPADAFAIITDETLCATEALFNVNDKLCRITLSLTGRHNVYNALAAASCAMALGVSVSAVAKGLCGLQGVKGRLQRTGSFRGAEIFVDFAHTPDGLEKSLTALRLHCKGRLICLFGCGGNRDTAKRPIMGEIAAKKADFCVLTSDNPRYEDQMDILSAIEKGYRRYSLNYVIVPDRKSAIAYAVDMLKEKDILLVAGKGGETGQEIMGIKYPFDDNDIIEKIIREKQGD
ncbi:MAG: UDP-N-acetylmuramoyl-L-alanyl-D-glutamate--2,6-diaminopimelate ligase [Clostridia bacterium]|nr:UDP-N-acetylmuramoyl-L-alanyl-D-glutamate--2,6-diaminopimelate ligase [Clostridia bacterium]